MSSGLGENQALRWFSGATFWKGASGGLPPVPTGFKTFFCSTFNSKFSGGVMALKVKAAVKPPEMQKLTLNLPVSTVQMLKAYEKAYIREYGEEPDEDYLVNEVIRDYLESDKDFREFLKENPEILEAIGEGQARKRGRKPGQKKTAEVGEQT